MESIPTADISAFVNDTDLANRQVAAEHLATTVRLHGWAAITGHGLSEPELQNAFATMKKLFALPIEEKMKAPHPDGPVPHRGYLKKGLERSGKLGIVHSQDEGEKKFFEGSVDWKETYDIGHEENEDQKNIWLPEDVFPGFRKEMVELYDRLTAIALATLEGLMLGMELNEEDCEILRKLHDPIQHQMRLAHYLPMSLEDRADPNKIRLAAHRDFSSFTLLFQEAGGSGLEFQDRQSGEYISATPREGVLYLNIGDLMERYSNGFYPSAMHRVAIDGTGEVPARLSIPFFALVGVKEEIYPMPSRVERDGEERFERIGYGELARRLFEPVMKKEGES